VIFKDRCPKLVNEIKMWKWKKEKLGQEKFVKEEPVRLNEDACKALTYLVGGRPETPKPPESKPHAWTEKSYEKACAEQGPLLPSDEVPADG